MATNIYAELSDWRMPKGEKEWLPYVVDNTEESESLGRPTAWSAAKADNDKRIKNTSDATGWNAILTKFAK